MDQKPTNWAEMQSDEESDRERREVAENVEENKDSSANMQVSMAKTQRKRPQMSKEDMIEKVKTLKRHVILNLLNVDFKAKAEDIEELYSNVKFLRIEPQQRGIWLIETENSEEALKILAGEEKSIRDRKITVRLGVPKRFDQDKEGNFNKEKRNFVEKDQKKPYHEHKNNYNKESKGSYNRKEFQESAHYKDENFKKSKPKTYEKPVEETAENLEKPHVESSRKPYGFTRNANAAKNSEKKEEVAKVVKANPFGSAKARDENEYVKKKKGEGVEKFEEIHEIKGATLEKSEVPKKTPEEKPQNVKHEEEEFIVLTNKKKTAKKTEENEKKEAPLQEKEKAKKANATENKFSGLLGEDEENDSADEK